MTTLPAVTRRTLITSGLAATVAAPALLRTGPLRAQDALVPKPAFPSVYPRRFGDGLLMAIADGYVTLPTAFVGGLTEAEVAADQAAAYAPDPASITAPVTCHILQLGDRQVMIDSGAGTSFGPTTGRLAETLAVLGIDPAGITDVLLTHLHPDHVGGLLGAEGPVFPNATIHLDAAELAWWTDPAQPATAPDLVKPFFQVAQGFAASYRDHLQTFNGEAEVLPGIRSLALPGHTVGHRGYHLAAGSEELIVAGDAVVFAAFQFVHPEATSLADTDPAVAIATRRALLDRASSDRLLLAATHLPFPGFGHVERRGEAFAWVPEVWRLG